MEQKVSTMLLPSDLRIGNFIQLNTIASIDSFCSVIGINSSIDGQQQIEVLIKSQRCQMDFRMATPAKLNEEWLVKFGFEASVSHDLFQKGDFPLYKMGDTFNIFFQMRTKQVDSVHQLQNLYFALTGEELTIKS